MTRPNVVLICADEWRGDCLSCEGHPDVRTPHIDSIADSGTRFTHAYSATPTCIPARVSLLTGQSQETHGRVGYQEGVPFTQTHGDTIASWFHDAGYQTHAIGKLHVFPERSRVGFDEVELHDGFLHFARDRYDGNFDRVDDYVGWLRAQPGIAPDEEYFDHGVGCNSTVARPWDKPERTHPTSWVGSRAVHWLDRRDPTRPFFLFVSFHRPHPPYDPPQWAFDMYIDQELAEVPRGDWLDDLAPYRTDHRHDLAVGSIDDRSLQRARAGYYGSITHVDMQVSRLIEALTAHGLASNTIMAFTSDHGELLGDHDCFRKALPYEGSARVPLIISTEASGRRVLDKARVSSVLAELRDIAPTLLDLAGVDVPASCDGQSLADIVRGEDQPVREWLHGEHVYLGQSVQWVTNGTLKYVWFSGTGIEQLFYLADDPHELHNLAADPDWSAELSSARSRLIEFLAAREEGFVEDGQLVTGRPVRAILAHPPGLPPQPDVIRID